MKYYRLYQDMERERGIICYSMPEDNDMTLKTFSSGKKYDIWDGSLCFYYEKDEGDIATDLLTNDQGWFVVSEKLREILELMNTEIQFLPIKIFEKASKIELPNYYIANILRVVDALCLEKSEYFESYIIEIGKIYTVAKYGIFAEKTEKSDVFKLADHQVLPIFVSHNFKKMTEEQGITGIVLSEIRVYENE